MDLAIIYLANESIFLLAYLLIAATVALFISLRVDRLHEFSRHRGISLFRQAFIFFSAAFLVQALMVIFGIWLSPVLYSMMPNPVLHGFITAALDFLFAYLISLPSFYLVYSLVWKKIEGSSYLSRARSGLLHVMAVMIAIIYTVSPGSGRHFLFIPQFIVLTYGLYISYGKYHKARQEKGSSHMQFYFITLVLMTAGWLVNYLEAYIGSHIFLFSLYAQLMTLGMFVFLAYNVIRITRRF